MQELNVFFRVQLKTDAIKADVGGMTKVITNRIYDFLRLAENRDLAPVLLRLDMRPVKGDWRRIRAKARVGVVVIVDDDYIPCWRPEGLEGEPVDAYAAALRSRSRMKLLLQYGGAHVGRISLVESKLPAPIVGERG
jgi:hypothetical protein